MPSPAQLDKPRYTGSISVPDHYMFGDIERAVVTMLGAASKCKVTVLSYDHAAKGEKGEQIDILRNASVEAEGNKLFITGESYRLRHEQKLRDAGVTLTLTLNGKCADCGYS